MGKGKQYRPDEWWDQHPDKPFAEGLGLDNIDFESLNWQDSDWRDFFSSEEKALWDSGKRKGDSKFDNMKQVRTNAKKEKKWLKAYKKANPDSQSVGEGYAHWKSKYNKLSKASYKAYKKDKKAGLYEGKNVKQFQAKDKDGFWFNKYSTQEEYDKTEGGKRNIAEKAAKDKKYGSYEDTKGMDRATLKARGVRMRADSKAAMDARAKVWSREGGMRYLAQSHAAAYRPWNQKSWLKDGTFNQKDADAYMYYKDLSSKMSEVQSFRGGEWDGIPFSKQMTGYKGKPGRVGGKPSRADLGKPRLGEPVVKAQAAPSITTPKETTRKVLPRVSARIKQKDANRSAGIYT